MKKISLLLMAIFLLSGCLRSTRDVKIRIDSNHQTTIQFFPPLKNMKVISPFGPRRNWYHTGLDIVGSKYVLAAQDGTVIKVGRGKGYGKMITLKHQAGYQTRYAHLKSYKVKRGEQVQKGKRIGVAGKTGNAKGPHLHFEILTPSGRFIDPKSALNQ